MSDVNTYGSKLGNLIRECSRLIKRGLSGRAEEQLGTQRAIA